MRKASTWLNFLFSFWFIFLLWNGRLKNSFIFYITEVANFFLYQHHPCCFIISILSLCTHPSRKKVRSTKMWGHKKQYSLGMCLIILHFLANVNYFYIFFLCLEHLDNLLISQSLCAFFIFTISKLPNFIWNYFLFFCFIRSTLHFILKINQKQLHF